MVADGGCTLKVQLVSSKALRRWPEGFGVCMEGVPGARMHTTRGGQEPMCG